MFERVTIQASDPAASQRFYGLVLPVLGSGAGDLAVVQAGAGAVTRRLHIGFGARSRAEVEEFWRVGTAAGHPDDGAPGPRPEYGDDYFGGFLLDPDGNSAEAVHHDRVRGDGRIDHLWIRVADLAESKRFYAALAPRAGFRIYTDTAERVGFASESGTFSLLAGNPTEGLRMAFAASEDAALQDPDGNTVELVRR